MGITDDTINPYYMSYDMARDALPTIGYNQRDEVVDTNTLRINLAISENEMGGRYTPENDDHIKKQLMDNMMLELYSKGYFNFQKQKEPHDFDIKTNYCLTLTVADKAHSSTITKENYFFWQGQEWSEAQIIEGLEQANPEFMV